MSIDVKGKDHIAIIRPRYLGVKWVSSCVRRPKKRGFLLAKGD